MACMHTAFHDQGQVVSRVHIYVEQFMSQLIRMCMAGHGDYRVSHIWSTAVLFNSIANLIKKVH